MSTSEAARVAGVHEKTIRRAIAAGTLVVERVNGAYRIAPEALEEWRSRPRSARSRTDTRTPIDTDIDTDTRHDRVQSMSSRSRTDASPYERLYREERDERIRLAARLEDELGRRAELERESGYWHGQADALTAEVRRLRERLEDEERDRVPVLDVGSGPIREDAEQLKDEDQSASSRRRWWPWPRR